MTDNTERGGPKPGEVSSELESHQYEAFKSWKWTAFRNRREFFTILINILLILGFASRVQHSALSLAGVFERSDGMVPSQVVRKSTGTETGSYDIHIPYFEHIDICICIIFSLVCFYSLALNFFSVIEVTAHPPTFTLMLMFLPTSILLWLNFLAFYKRGQIGVDERGDFFSVTFVSMVAFHNLGAPQIWTDAIAFQSFVICFATFVTGYTNIYLVFEYGTALLTAYNIVFCQDYELFRSFIADRKRKKLMIDSDMVLMLDKLYSKVNELSDELQNHPPAPTRHLGHRSGSAASKEMAEEMKEDENRIKEEGEKEANEEAKEATKMEAVRAELTEAMLKYNNGEVESTRRYEKDGGGGGRTDLLPDLIKKQCEGYLQSTLQMCLSLYAVVPTAIARHPGVRLSCSENLNVASRSLYKISTFSLRAVIEEIFDEIEDLQGRAMPLYLHTDTEEGIDHMCWAFVVTGPRAVYHLIFKLIIMEVIETNFADGGVLSVRFL